MSEGGFSDVSRIVSLIMENPKLIEEISNLARQSESGEAPASDGAREEENATATPTSSEATVASAPLPPQHRAAPRAQLLCALKPYVSKERANAIDSMLTISEILDMMRSR